MLRPPRLLFIIAASCLTLFAQTASAQFSSGFDDESSEPSSGSAGSVSASDFSDEPSSAPAAPAGNVAPAASDVGDEAAIDARLQRVGEAVKGIQAPLRAYTAGWVILQAGLTGYFAYDATLRKHERAVRASDIMRATISGLNTLLTLAKPMPGRSAYRKWKQMPEGTKEEKLAKIDFGIHAIGAQIAADKKNAAPQEHVVAALVGIGFGAGLLFGYDDGLRPAVETTLGIILLAELQFATRPWRTRRYNMELAMDSVEKKPAVELSFAPIVTRTSRGIGLVGRF